MGTREPFWTMYHVAATVLTTDGSKIPALEITLTAMLSDGLYDTETGQSDRCWHRSDAKALTVLASL